MFSNLDDNYNMLVGAYKKIKSYYYYNKNFLFMRKKIAEFEYDEEQMKNTLSFLALLLKSPNKHKKSINELIQRIDYYVLPKAFKNENSADGKFVTNALQKNKCINKVNFFIDMPFELHLLETVWTILLGEIVYDKKVIGNYCYGNVIDNKKLYHQKENGKRKISFEKNNLFKVYYNQYCSWKNNAIDTIDSHKNAKNLVMISFDIKSYFYSIKWKFNILDDILDSETYARIAPLTKIVENIFFQYTKVIKEVREIKQDEKKQETVLPIGLFCSMLLANVYLAEYDKNVHSLNDVLYYGRYVDDILVVLDMGQEKFKCNEEELNSVLKTKRGVLEQRKENMYCICGFEELLIQKDKLKIFYFEQGKSDSLIRQLKKTKIVPSQMNIVPDSELKMTDFEESAYAIRNFSIETKIRELGQLEVNKFKLAWHMAATVRNAKNRSDILSNEEKADKQTEGKNILSFFVGSNALEFSNNWINALYYFMLTKQVNRNSWKRFEINVREAIKTLRLIQPEDIKKNKRSGLKTTMKKQLTEQLDICIATALAINPKFYKKETSEVINLVYKLRKANLFNHYLVTYPLINYLDDLEKDFDLTNIQLEQLRNINFDIKENWKMFYTPRFITMEEFFHYTFLESISHRKGWHLTEEKIAFLRNVFYCVNNIDTTYAKPLQIEIREKTESENYYLQEINLQGKEYDLTKIRIGVANIKLKIKDCCLGIESEKIERSRTDFFRFLKETYGNGKNKVDFLLFPEFYLPLQWIDDILLYVRRTGITVITGIQYISFGRNVCNTIGVFTQICSGKYNSSCMIIREKNDYAPFEKQLLALEGYYCKDHKKPIYTIVNSGGLRFGTFLCYEFTDIKARSLFKDNVDILFTPENNKDTAYFSNIIETMTRDLHAFIVQANTSIYGDSRITGPYSRNQRNIVQIKGGDTDNVIIGTIDLAEICNNRKKERKELENTIQTYIEMSPLERKEKKKEMWAEESLKVSKVSARTTY